MNNLKKFEITRKSLTEFQKKLPKFEEDARKKREKKGVTSKVYSKSFNKVLELMSLSINKKYDIIAFDSKVFGSYRQIIWLNYRRRINIVPVCFLIQMYVECLQTSGVKDFMDVDIPFTLRSFWSMERAISLYKRLMELHIYQETTIQRLINYNSKDKEKVTELRKLLKEVEQLQLYPYVNGKMEIRLVDRNMSFFINTRNVKLDVVPLCKLMVAHYVCFMKKLSSFEKIYITNELERVMLVKMKDMYTSFMDDYFAQKLPIC